MSRGNVRDSLGSSMGWDWRPSALRSSSLPRNAQKLQSMPWIHLQVDGFFGVIGRFEYKVVGTSHPSICIPRTGYPCRSEEPMKYAWIPNETVSIASVKPVLAV